MSFYHWQRIGKVSLWNSLGSVALYVNGKDEITSKVIFWTKLSVIRVCLSPRTHLSKQPNIWLIVVFWHILQINICPLTESKVGITISYSVLDNIQDKWHGLPALIWWGLPKSVAPWVNLTMSKLPTTKDGRVTTMTRKTMENLWIFDIIILGGVPGFFLVKISHLSPLKCFKFEQKARRQQNLLSLS